MCKIKRMKLAAQFLILLIILRETGFNSARATEPCKEMTELVEFKTSGLSIQQKIQGKVSGSIKSMGRYFGDIAFIYSQPETRNYLFNKLFAALGVQGFVQLGLPALGVLGSQGPLEMILVDFAVTASAVTVSTSSFLKSTIASPLKNHLKKQEELALQIQAKMEADPTQKLIYEKALKKLDGKFNINEFMDQLALDEFKKAGGANANFMKLFIIKLKRGFNKDTLITLALLSTAIVLLDAFSSKKIIEQKIAEDKNVPGAKERHLNYYNKKIEFSTLYQFYYIPKTIVAQTLLFALGKFPSLQKAGIWFDRASNDYIYFKARELYFNLRGFDMEKYFPHKKAQTPEEIPLEMGGDSEQKMVQDFFQSEILSVKSDESKIKKLKVLVEELMKHELDQPFDLGRIKSSGVY